MDVSNPWAVFLHGAVWDCWSAIPAPQHILQLLTPPTVHLPFHHPMGYELHGKVYQILGITWCSARPTWKHKCFTLWQAVLHSFSSRPTDPESSNFTPQTNWYKYKSNYRGCSNIYSLVLYFNITLYLTIIFLKFLVLMYLKQSNRVLWRVLWDDSNETPSHRVHIWKDMTNPFLGELEGCSTGWAHLWFCCWTCWQIAITPWIAQEVWNHRGQALSGAVLHGLGCTSSPESPEWKILHLSPGK